MRTRLYVAFVGGLTLSAMNACAWQVRRYKESVGKWDVIAAQLKGSPVDLASSKAHEFEYVSTVGSYGDSPPTFVHRYRANRAGRLVFRVMSYEVPDEENPKATKTKQIVALDGWQPDDQEYELKPMKGLVTGILRKSEKVDYLHTKLKGEAKTKFGLNTFLDLGSFRDQLRPLDEVNTEFYFEVFAEPVEDSGGDAEIRYPLRASKLTFELPYLLPSKHRDYAAFWGLTSFVGLFAIGKAMTF